MRFAACDSSPQTSLAGDAATQWLPITISNCVGAGKFLGVQRIFTHKLANLPEKNSIRKSDLQKKSFHVILSAIFAQVFKVLLRFSGILWRFSEILPKFLPNQNFWRCDCTPCTPTSYTSDDKTHCFIVYCLKRNRWMCGNASASTSFKNQL